jgi:hypothetical protein
LSAPAERKPTEPQPSEAQAAPVETQIRYVAPNYEPYRKALAGKKAAIVGALIYGIGALAFQATGITFSAMGETTIGTTMVIGGGALIGASAVTLAASFFMETPE